MNTRGIYARLFIISAVFLAAFVGGLLLFQTRYFGSIYTAQKEAQFYADMRAARDGLDGLGLSIMKMGIEKHGGRVGMRNTAGGVLFFFEVPKSA